MLESIARGRPETDPGASDHDRWFMRWRCAKARPERGIVASAVPGILPRSRFAVPGRQCYGVTAAAVTLCMTGFFAGPGWGGGQFTLRAGHFVPLLHDADGSMGVRRQSGNHHGPPDEQGHE